MKAKRGALQVMGFFFLCNCIVIIILFYLSDKVSWSDSSGNLIDIWKTYYSSVPKGSLGVRMFNLLFPVILFGFFFSMALLAIKDMISQNDAREDGRKLNSFEAFIDRIFSSYGKYYEEKSRESPTPKNSFLKNLFRGGRSGGGFGGGSGGGGGSSRGFGF